MSFFEYCGFFMFGYMVLRRLVGFWMDGIPLFRDGVMFCEDSGVLGIKKFGFNENWTVDLV